MLLSYFPIPFSVCVSSKGTQKETQGKSNDLLLRSALTTEASITDVPWKENISPPAYVSDRQSEGEMG